MTSTPNPEDFERARRQAESERETERKRYGG